VALLGPDGAARLPRLVVADGASQHGELTNTVVLERVGQRLVVFRGGRSTHAVRGLDTTTLVGDGSRSLDAVVSDATSRGWVGIELLSGIPGTVGAAVVQNAGAYGQELSQVFERAVAYERSTGELVTLRPEDLGFGSRTTRLKSEPGYSPDLVVLAVHLALWCDPPGEIGYEELARHHAASGRDPRDLAARRASVLEVRSRKGMVVHGEHWRPSAGSYFVGPRVPRDLAVRIATEVRGERFAQRFLDRQGAEAEQPRLPAALALRAAGFINGDHWGRVGLSDRHILAVCNRGGATGTDVVAVSRMVQQRVRDEIGIELRPEVRYLGELPDLDLAEYEHAHPFRRGEGEPEWTRAMGQAP